MLRQGEYEIQPLPYNSGSQTLEHQRCLEVLLEHSVLGPAPQNF